MDLKASDQVGATRLVAHALRVFDMSHDPDRVEHERRALRREARVYGPEVLAHAVTRCEQLLELNRQDEVATQALALLVGLRNERS